MKAITLWQPWASLLACGAKQIETRGWATPYRGPLAIHAAQLLPSRIPGGIPPRKAQAILAAPGLAPAAGGKPFDALPRGCVLATARLVDCLPMADAGGGAIRLGSGPSARLLTPEEDEFWFGDYAPGRFAWLLRDIRPLARPVPAKGSQGFWQWAPPAETAAL